MFSALERNILSLLFLSFSTLSFRHGELDTAKSNILEKMLFLPNLKDSWVRLIQGKNLLSQCSIGQLVIKNLTTLKEITEKVELGKSRPYQTSAYRGPDFTFVNEVES